MKNIDVLVQNSKVSQLFFENESNIYGFNYTNDTSPISLTMPYKPSTYQWKNRLYHLSKKTFNRIKIRRIRRKRDECHIRTL